uniref:Uncharacterized protein n=1 Tax=Ignisphaera aggregans TaxID=334771 RepID=A0A7J3Z8Q3_9CREN
MSSSFREIFTAINMLSGIAVAALLILTQQSYVNYIATLFVYVTAMFFIARALLALYLNTPIAVLKIPRTLVRFQKIKSYAHKLLLFTVASMVFESIASLVLKSFVYSAILSTLASILVLYILDRVVGAPRLYRLYSIAIVTLALALYLVKLLDESVYSGVDPQLRFLEVLLSGWE